MSHYTTEVRFICEQYAGEFTSSDYSTVESVIENSRKKIFDFDFPIYDESYRSVLETKILKRYYTREIGFETVALWKFWLNKRLNEIMPYYNQLYESQLLEIDPLLSFRETEQLERTTDVENSSDRVDTQGESRSTTNDQTGTQEQNQTSDRLRTAKGGEKVSTKIGRAHV